MKALVNEAARLGIRVHVEHIDGPELGYYVHDERLIIVRLGMTLPQTKETLGHELGHAYYGHECSRGQHERLADQRGAFLLVDPDQYEDAARIDEHPNAIATELGLTPYVIRIWRDYWLPRLVRKGLTHA